MNSFTQTLFFGLLNHKKQQTKQLTNISLKLVTVCFWLFCFNDAKAQFCGTTFEEKKAPPNVTSRVQGPTSHWQYLPCKSATIRVKFHVIRDNQGQGGFANPYIDVDILTILNTNFNPANIFFVSNSPINYINSSPYYYTNLNSELIDNNGDGKFDQFHPDQDLNAIDIYLVANGPSSISGKAAEIGSTAIILGGLPGATSVSELLICHEMGHCLGLYHTFHGTACTEKPDGSFEEAVGAGDVSGDYVIDTWPDPTSGFLGGRDSECREYVQPIHHGCGGSTSTTDRFNHPWRPLVDNFMDYYSPPGGYTFTPPCHLKFTDGQFARMLAAIANDNNVNKTVSKQTGIVNISSTGSLVQCSDNTSAVILEAHGQPDLYYCNWSNTQNNTHTINVNPPATTTYTVTATSRCMFDANAEITIHIDEDIDFTITGNNSICEGGSSNYSIDDQGNTNYFNGTWSVASGLGTISSNGVLTVPAGSGNTSVTITYTATTNILGCTPSVSRIIPVVPRQIPVTIIPSQNPVCEGTTNISLTASDSRLTYLWSTGETTQTIYVNPSLANHIYSVDATTPCGDVISSTINVVVNPSPAITIVPFSQPICVGSSGLSVQFTTNPANLPVNWSIIPGGNSIHPITNELLVAAAGNFTIEGSVTDNNGCMSSGTAPLKVFTDQPAIEGESSVCTGKTLPLLVANAPGGKWSVDNPSIAAISSTGVLTGLNPGTAWVSYEVELCGITRPLSKRITVNQTPTILQSNNVLNCGGVYQFLANMPGTWSSNNSSVAVVNQNGQVASVSAGTTLIVFTPNQNVCQSESISIPVTVINCSPVVCGNEASTVIPGPLVSNTTFQNGLFYIDEDIIVEGVVTFENAQVRLTPGVSITVADGAELKILGSHFYGCGGMWRGISLSGDNGRITMDQLHGQSSFIEDADIALLYSPNTPVPAYTGSEVLTIRHTTFNRNRISIQIDELVDVQNAPGDDLPIIISNCIFTSRNIPFEPSVVAWDNVSAILSSATVSATPYSFTPESYSSPFIRQLHFNDNVPEALLKDGLAANKPDAGIVINYSGTREVNNWKAVIVGAAGTVDSRGISRNTNLFDNLNIGIKALNSNLKVVNSTFQKPVANTSFEVSGAGIYSRNTYRKQQMPTGFGNPPPPQLPPNADGGKVGYVKIISPAGTYNNAFFDMHTAIEIQEANAIDISNCDIRSNQDASHFNLSDIGNKGIVVYTVAYEDFNISNNNIQNIKTGVMLNIGTMGCVRDMPQQTGPLVVKNNTIAEASLFGIVPPANPWLGNGIYIAEGLYGAEDEKRIICTGNSIAAGVNGITLSGYRLHADITDNEIILAADKTGNATDQHGISLAGSTWMPVAQETKIQDNTITGPGMNYNSTGILLEQSNKVNLGCNTVGDNTHGFRFVGLNPQTRFWDNTMSITNKYGFTLWEDGAIDKQGNEGTVDDPNVCTSNNSWELPASIWTQQPGQFMTYCHNSEASKSPLVIRNSGSNPQLNPDGSGYSSDPNTPGYKYSIADGTLILTNSSDGTCNRCDNASIFRQKKLLEEIAEGTVLLPADDPEERLEVMRQQLYELLNSNAELLVNSNTLQQFMLDNQWSNLDFIHYAARYVAEGRYDLVQMLLGSWPGHTGLDEAYYRYFDWLTRMHENPDFQPDLQDVWELANTCPLKNGTVVYAVRNLYNALTREIHEFENNCENPSARRSQHQQEFIRLKQKQESTKILNTELKNNLVVYPNPANGLVNIEGQNINQVDIIDIAGRLLLSQTFSNVNKAQLNIYSLKPGLVFVKVIGKDSKISVEKLLIQ